MKTVSSKKLDFTKRPLMLALASALALSSGAVLAEPMFMIPLANGNLDMSRYDTNYIELGGLYSSKDSGKFGEWNGVREQGGYGIANFNFMNRNDTTATYYSLTGRNLALDSRQLSGNFGTQGKYGLTADFQQIKHLTSNTTQFIFDGAGGTNLTLPPGFTGVPGQPPASAGAISDALQPHDLQQKRNIYKFGGNVFFGGTMEALINYRYDDRTGTGLTGAVMGNNGGNPRSTLMPLPINDNTQQIEAKLRWNTEKAQVEGMYYFSKYSNDNNSLTWQNPYNAISGWLPDSGFPGGTGRMSLAPDNSFHQFQLTGGYNFTPVTRLTGVASYGMMRQDASFLPYGVDTNGIAFNSALPRNSLDGKVNNTLLDFKFTTRLFDKLSIKAVYNYNDYNNKTPSSLYNYVGGDTTSQVVIPVGASPNDVNSSNLRFNDALGWKKNKFKLDANYPLAGGFSVRGYYNYEKTDYKPSEENLRSDINDNIFGVELRKRASAWVTGSLKYEYQQRRGSGFDPNAPYYAGYTDATTAAGFYDNLPTLRQFFIADYNQNKLKGMLFLTPADALSFSLTGDWYQRDYKGPGCGDDADQILQPGNVMDSRCAGRQKGLGQSYTIDGQWTPVDGLSAYAFYTWSQFKTDQNGRSNTNSATAADPTRNWSVTQDNRSNTFGVGARFVPVERNFDLGLQYVWDNSRSPVDIWSGTGNAAPTTVPTAKYRMDYLQLYGSYQVNTNIKLRFNTAYAHVRGKDWKYDDVTASSSNNVILPQQVTANYNEYLIGVSIAYTWN
ncbi:MAG: MtrB/PioB family decaheme-associated outer membrane protein [Burkholderiales bacterium]|jgi:MtrB/PioB family decaheme-associated outer membrane protein|nr:MtrB/PioB family decaheme-associated outer membrane protein [Burkholderiales bacterium]